MRVLQGVWVWISKYASSKKNVSFKHIRRENCNYWLYLLTLPWTQLTGSPKSANADSFNLTFLSLTSDPTEIEVSESSKYCPNLELRKDASTADTIVAS